jgi:hypothetical protein
MLHGNRALVYRSLHLRAPESGVDLFPGLMIFPGQFLPTGCPATGVPKGANLPDGMELRRGFEVERKIPQFWAKPDGKRHHNLLFFKSL